MQSQKVRLSRLEQEAGPEERLILCWEQLAEWGQPRSGLYYVRELLPEASQAAQEAAPGELLTLAQAEEKYGPEARYIVAEYTEAGGRSSGLEL